jgi:hypothetical protein
MERPRAPWAARFFPLLVLLGFGLSGCGGKHGTVSGKVTYQGQPLTSGLVIFVDRDGKVTQPAGIEVDGSYAADKVPVGPMAVCVETHPLSGGDGGPNTAKDQLRPRYVPLPTRYKDAKQSGLSLDVKPGQNVYDIELR